ncbi:MAG: 16S rRNA (cytosine(1402)-N(4))-methyltransferase RsmH [Bacteroidota bacterium]
MENNNYHLPVMSKETIEGLAIQPYGTYVDLTFGGGGHTRAILQQLNTHGRLFAFDQDPDSALQAANIKDPRLTFIQANFRFCTQFLATHNTLQVDGILADLGVSSFQLNEPTRGFANRMNGPLDMRMNYQVPLSATQLINNYSPTQIITILQQYGEIHNPKKLTQHIIRNRKINPITTTAQLTAIATPCAPRKRLNKYLAKVFQAFRIAVNDELGALKELLLQTPNLLKSQGRLVILAYHSLEDKLVKNFIKTGSLEGKLNHDPYGNLLRPLQPVHRKALKASETEIAHNNRARSARLRIAEKVTVPNSVSTAKN